MRRIVENPTTGEPVFEGTEITVPIIKWLKSRLNWTVGEIAYIYKLTRNEVRAALEYVDDRTDVGGDRQDL